MASQITPCLNEATKNRTKQSSVGFNIRFTETPFPSRKLKSVPLNANANTFSKKNTITFDKKSCPFSKEMNSNALMLNKIKQLEIRLGESDIKNKRVRKKT